MKTIYFLVFMPLLMLSCKEEVEEPKKINWNKEQSSELSKTLAIQEEIDIKLFLEMRLDWPVRKTGSGLMFALYDSLQTPLNRFPRFKDRASIEYKVKLLDGTLCYQTEDDEYEVIVVDNSELESGIQEAIKLMRIGDKAHLVIPSHLGHGLLGDMDKIPPLTPITVDLKLIDIK